MVFDWRGSSLAISNDFCWRMRINKSFMVLLVFGVVAALMLILGVSSAYGEPIEDSAEKQTAEVEKLDAAEGKKSNACTAKEAEAPGMSPVLDKAHRSAFYHQNSSGAVFSPSAGGCVPGNGSC